VDVPKTATEAMMQMRDSRVLPRDSLLRSLFHSFMMNGYECEEAEKLAAIAIGPVSAALDFAQAAYKLHIEAIEVGLPGPMIIKQAPK